MRTPRTFLEALDLLVREGGAVALELALEPEPHLRVLVAGRVVHVRVAVGDVAVVAVCEAGRVKRRLLAVARVDRDQYRTLYTSIFRSSGALCSVRTGTRAYKSCVFVVRVCYRGLGSSSPVCVCAPGARYRPRSRA